jgi:hypothetical protein
MTTAELWQEANAANREYMDGKLSWKDFMAIVHDLAEGAKNGN